MGRPQLRRGVAFDGGGVVAGIVEIAMCCGAPLVLAWECRAAQGATRPIPEGQPRVSRGRGARRVYGTDIGKKETIPNTQRTIPNTYQWPLHDTTTLSAYFLPPPSSTFGVSTPTPPAPPICSHGDV